MSENGRDNGDAGAAEASPPLKVLIAHGSVQGTTGRIGEAIAAGLEAAGASAAAVDLELAAMMPARLAEADLLGFGTPVYFLREAAYVTDFIAGLPSLEGRRVFVYAACGMNRVGETLHRLQGQLAERGALVVGARHFSSAMSYRPYRQRGLGNAEDLPDEAVLAAARRFGEELVAASNASSIPLPEVSAATRLKARLLASRAVRRAVFPAVELRHDLCTGYGSCVSRCPFEGWAREDEEEMPRLTDACIQCLQCVDFCPKGAITADAPLKSALSALAYRLGLH